MAKVAAEIPTVAAISAQKPKVTIVNTIRHRALRQPTFGPISPGTETEEHKTDEDKEQIDGLAPHVALLEHEGAEKEADEDR